MSEDDSDTAHPRPPKKKLKTSSSSSQQHHLLHNHDEDISSDESEEWEEVEDQEFEYLELESKRTNHGDVGEKAVEISIDVPGTSGAKNNRVGQKSQWAKLVQWQVNRFNKLLQLQLHKAHLVCLLAGVLHSNKMCKDAEMQALALSQVPVRLVQGMSSSRGFDMSWFTKVIKWLTSAYKVQDHGSDEPKLVIMKPDRSQCLKQMVAPCYRDKVRIFLTTVRALGFQSRLVESLRPLPRKYAMLSAVSEKQKTQKKTPKKRKSQPKASEKSQRKTRSKASNRKIVSSSSEEEAPCNKDASSQSAVLGADQWIEVYNSADKQWMCVDCVGGHINQPNVCEQNATRPISYVIAIDNESSVKDVTRRYASKWMFETEKLRVQSDWWQNTLKPYSTSHTSRDRSEDAVLQKQLLDKPLPTIIAEYKNHHLYALKRHQLKFEALYPSSPAILGYCKGEAVYSRECVHNLHTRETWLKQGLAIRRNEKPYKVVKGRPKKNKSDEPPMPLFGKWQTELYIPRPAVDGKVPRNEYGNVELFQPSMLPMGTVQLHIPGLNRTAQRLGIDCAPAMVGWDYHGGYCHPVFDGVIVCKEFQEKLLDAWEKDESEKEQQRKQKRDIRIWKNWKVLIKGVLVKERLNKLYNSVTTVKPPTHGKCSTP